MKQKDLLKCPCPTCEELFSSNSALIDHIAESKRNDLNHNHFFFNELNQDDWVECNLKECHFRAENLKHHINKKHNMNTNDYIGKIHSKNNEKKLESLKKESREKRFKHVCNTCEPKTYFQTERSLEMHFLNSKDLKHNHEFYNDSKQDEWVECKICNMRKQFLSRHLTTEHNLTTEKYKELFKNAEIFSKNYKETQFREFIIAGAKNEQRHETRKSHRHIKCPVESCNKIFCSQEGLKEHLRDTDNKEHSKILFNELNKNDWVECKFCGCRRSNLVSHLKSKHNITSKQYYERFKEKFISENLLNIYRENGRHANDNRDLTSINNSFYGKHHTKETKQRITNTLLSKRNVNDLKKEELKVLEEKDLFENQQESIIEILTFLSENGDK